MNNKKVYMFFYMNNYYKLLIIGISARIHQDYNLLLEICIVCSCVTIIITDKLIILIFFGDNLILL